MRILSLLFFALILGVFGLAPSTNSRAQSAAPPPSASISPASGFSPPPLPSPNGLAPLAERVANAKSVRVQTAILGLELGSTLEQAHAKLDKLRDPAQPAKEEKEDSEKGEESENRVLWQLAGTEYAVVYVKADGKERVTYINAFLRPGKEISFDKIGETKKAPIRNSNLIAWDVIRPNHPLFRVVASGKNQKANTVSIFIVNRPPSIKPDRTGR